MDFFCELLTEIGFDAHLIAARVFSRDNGYGLPMDHDYFGEFR